MCVCVCVWSVCVMCGVWWCDVCVCGVSGELSVVVSVWCCVCVCVCE